MLTLILATTLALPQSVPTAKPDAVPAAKGTAAPKKVTPEPQEPTMFPGSPAPFPAIENFVKGDSISGFEPNKVYVVEFWATWCGPCKAGMPHLSEVQHMYADKSVQVIGISDEKLDVVKKFLDAPEWAEKTKYTLCADPDRSSYNQYMKPAMQNGIPCAFIVKNSVVQWIGHPMTMDEPIAAIVAGTWDIAKAKDSFMGAAQASKVQRRMSALLREAQTTKEYGPFLGMLDEAIAKATPDEAMGLELQKFQILLGGADQPEAAYVVGKKVVAALIADKNAMGLNQVAWFVLDSKTVKTRDIAFALNAAQAAATASDGKDGAILDTLARAYWDSANQKLAIETQKSAIDKTPAGPMLDEMKVTLKKYETGSPGNGKAI